MKRIALAVAMMAAGPGWANTPGNSLHEACSSSDAAMAGFCIGHVIGVIEGIRYGMAVPMWAAGDYSADQINQTSDTLLAYCPPDGVENGQYVDVVKQYLQSHPQDRHKPARLLIHVALTEAFPCSTP